MKAEFNRITWVTCPKCKWRYYLGAQVLMVEGHPAICPKCRLEFDPRPHLDPKMTQVQAHEVL